MRGAVLVLLGLARAHLCHYGKLEEKTGLCCPPSCAVCGGDAENAAPCLAASARPRVAVCATDEETNCAVPPVDPRADGKRVRAEAKRLASEAKKSEQRARHDATHVYATEWERQKAAADDAKRDAKRAAADAKKLAQRMKRDARANETFHLLNCATGKVVEAADCRALDCLPLHGGCFHRLRGSFRAAAPA